MGPLIGFYILMLLAFGLIFSLSHKKDLAHGLQEFLGFAIPIVICVAAFWGGVNFHHMYELKVKNEKLYLEKLYINNELQNLKKELNK